MPPTYSEKLNTNENKKPFVYAFATLRSMDGVEILLDAYKRYDKSGKRNCIKFCHLCCCRCVFKKDFKRIKLREIDGVYPKVEEAIMPDNIQWKNMGYS
jgi:hypothetical protein